MKLIRSCVLGVLLLIPFLASDTVLAKGGHRYKGGKAIDGDTFRYGQKRYRIQQYNAPEIGKPGWKESTKKLQKKLDSDNYKWEHKARDKYGRDIVEEQKE